jgi:hypothetical protein
MLHPLLAACFSRLLSSLPTQRQDQRHQEAQQRTQYNGPTQEAIPRQQFAPGSAARPGTGGMSSSQRRLSISDVIVRNRANGLFVFDTNTGEQIGKLKVKYNTSMKHDPERSPAVYKGLLIVPFGDNRIFAYKLK